MYSLSKRKEEEEPRKETKILLTVGLDDKAIIEEDCVKEVSRYSSPGSRHFLQIWSSKKTTDSKLITIVNEREVQ